MLACLYRSSELNTGLAKKKWVNNVSCWKNSRYILIRKLLSYLKAGIFSSFLTRHPAHIKWLHGSSVASRMTNRQIGHWKFCVIWFSLPSSSKGYPQISSVFFVRHSEHSAFKLDIASTWKSFEHVEHFKDCISNTSSDLLLLDDGVWDDSDLRFLFSIFHSEFL